MAPSTGYMGMWDTVSVDSATVKGCAAARAANASAATASQAPARATRRGRWWEGMGGRAEVERGWGGGGAAVGCGGGGAHCGAGGGGIG